MTNEVLRKIKPLVIADYKKTGILASLTAAQMILESGWLKSGLTVHANNAFGIKGSYKGHYYVCNTKEFVNGKYVTIAAKFKRYPSLAESIADHSALLCKPRYAKVRAAKEYKAACHAVKAAGYATAPNYTESLIKLIERYRLYEWDEKDSEKQEEKNEVKVGAIIHFSGGYHYRSSDAKSPIGRKRTAGRAKVTHMKKGALHPYHLIGVNGGSDVYGWVSRI